MTLDEIVGLTGGGSALALLTVGVVEAIKRAFPALDPRWIPLVAIAVGVVLAAMNAVLLRGMPLEAAPFAGIAVGLMAVGLFSGQRAVRGR